MRQTPFKSVQSLLILLSACSFLHLNLIQGNGGLSVPVCHFAHIHTHTPFILSVVGPQHAHTYDNAHLNERRMSFHANFYCYEMSVDMNGKADVVSNNIII